MSGTVLTSYLLLLIRVRDVILVNVPRALGIDHPKGNLNA